jgi:predicted glycosyltransferase
MNGENKKRKIVVYSHDTFGLGNIRRMLVIAQSLVESDPNTSVLILSGSPMLHAFRIPPQIDYIKLPLWLLTCFIKARISRLNFFRPKG